VRYVPDHAATALAKEMGLTQPAVSISVKRGEDIAQERGLRSQDFIRIYKFMDVPYFIILLNQGDCCVWFFLIRLLVSDRSCVKVQK
jgi:hypothetical protein